MVQLLAQFGSGITSNTTFFEDDSKVGTTSLTNIELLVSRIIGILTVLGAIFFIVYFVIAALKWVTAGGDSSKVQKARDQMIQGVLGLILLVASYAIIGLIGTIVGIDILNPAQLLSGMAPANSSSNYQMNQVQNAIDDCVAAGTSQAECIRIYGL